MKHRRISISGSSTAGGDGGGIAFFAIDSTSSYNPVSAVLSMPRS